MSLCSEVNILSMREDPERAGDDGGGRLPMSGQICIRDYRGGRDKRELRAIGLPAKYIRQYTNSPPIHLALKLLGICANHLYVMTMNGSSKVIGTILLRQRLDIRAAGYSWRMHAVFVAPELRGRGFGANLVFHALEALRARGVKEVTLKVDCDNAPAISLYKKCGFVQDNRIGNQFIFSRPIS
jgi:ribosomal protein S18 acetylase RimI-like enzyme